jgi:glutathione S-transferase
MPDIIIHSVIGSPYGHVPLILDHDGFVLYETQAILRYVDRSFPDCPLSPLSTRALARMDQLLNICDWYLMQGVNNVIGFERIVVPRFLGRKPDEDVTAQAMPKARLVLGELERFLGSEAFLESEFPSLAAWLERLHARDSFIATTDDRLINRQREVTSAHV